MRKVCILTKDRTEWRSRFVVEPSFEGPDKYVCVCVCFVRDCFSFTTSTTV